MRNNTITGFLEAQWPSFELAGTAQAPALSTVFLTPGFQASRHVIAFVMVNGASTPALVVKWPRIPGDQSRLDIEAKNLAYLSEAREGGFPGVPRVLAYREWHGYRLLVETMIPGRLMRAATVKADRDICLDTVRLWLTGLHNATMQTSPGATHQLSASMDHCIDTLVKAFILTRDEEIAIEQTAHFANMLLENNAPAVFAHGDFAAPNLLLDEHRALGVVDWELSEPCDLALSDWIFFLTFAAFAAKQANCLESQITAFQEAFWQNGWATLSLKQFAKTVRLDPVLIRPLFVLSWARYVANMILRLRGNGNRLSNETVAWLRKNRYYQLWQIAARDAGQLPLDIL